MWGLHCWKLKLLNYVASFTKNNNPSFKTLLYLSCLQHFCGQSFIHNVLPLFGPLLSGRSMRPPEFPVSEATFLILQRCILDNLYISFAFTCGIISNQLDAYWELFYHIPDPHSWQMEPFYTHMAYLCFNSSY